MKNIKLAEECVEYILDTESEDFDENPSKEHIYFSAMAYKFGSEYAQEMLNEVLNANDK